MIRTKRFTLLAGSIAAMAASIGAIASAADPVMTAVPPIATSPTTRPIVLAPTTPAEPISQPMMIVPTRPAFVPKFARVNNPPAGQFAERDYAVRYTYPAPIYFSFGFGVYGGCYGGFGNSIHPNFP